MVDKKEKPPVQQEPAAAPAVEEEVSAEEEQKLPFPTAAVVREMKKTIDSSKMVRKEVKVAMNKFLGEVVKDVSARLDKYPYAMIDYRMFEESVRPYKQVRELHLEKKRIATKLNSIIEDCASVQRDLDAKFSEES
ncbi:hypothetical protein HYS54_00085 [Candidatus Micrarchaeota archaeon]|nr:hypothetical protein [Candidatus Micrarchaeota archaeon]